MMAQDIKVLFKQYGKSNSMERICHHISGIANQIQPFIRRGITYILDTIFVLKALGYCIGTDSQDFHIRLFSQIQAFFPQCIRTSNCIVQNIVSRSLRMLGLIAFPLFPTNQKCRIYYKCSIDPHQRLNDG